MASTDVVIIGAGVVGMAAALGLSRQGISVVLIDRNPLPTRLELGAEVADYDVRVSALTRRSQSFLTDLGVWQGVLEQRCCPYRHMEVWDDEGTGRIRFDAVDIGDSNIGHIVENRVLAASLAEALLDSAVRVLAPTEIQQLENHSSGIRIEANGETIDAELLLGADGALSSIRAGQGFFTREWDYGHTGIVATLKMERQHQATAWQNFLTTGPLALLPLADPNMVSMVWSCEDDMADQLMAADDATFMAQLEIASEGVLGRVEACSVRHAFPLRQRHAVDYVKNRVVLIGDAAHTIHPLAGQGMNLGLADAEVLLAELQRSVKRHLGVAHEQGLRRYQRRRKADNLAMMWTMEGFKRLFSRRELAIRWLRNEGMSGLNRLTHLKDKIVHYALGA